jgi:acyl-CoA synthetase (AMP-forming)/AMP-acid ligase II/acetyltransferase-like isoleucine patch superfamily enzyme
MGIGRKSRIALVLPNGPELALALLGLAHWASCVPLNANGALSELKKDLQAAEVSMVVGIQDDSAVIQDMARALNIPFCCLVKSETEVGVFRLIPIKDTWMNHSCVAAAVAGAGGGTVSESKQDNHLVCNNHDDEVLVLFTSGTTGNKKLVPHKLGDILIAAAVISVSWNLSPQDVNINLMPLFHVGGIVRQIFGPVLSGGSVICCPSFDPNLFWSLLTSKSTSSSKSSEGSSAPAAFTWYYAAPTMHQVILASKPEDLTTVPKLRMIANAAGGLLPSLAQELRNMFGANVLPSYGMTECMPISSPPFSYQLEKPGTSGVAVGPQIQIFSNNFKVLPPGIEGNICVRGRPCFHGYGGQPLESSFLEGGWFNTGDLGYLDNDGYLYITGRSKEVINRGGEIISPMEVEEEVLQHPAVNDCLAFSAPHDVLQEIVGIVIVPRPGVPKLDLPSLHDFLQDRLVNAKWPQCLVFMNALPKSHTNKLLRVKLGQRLNLAELNDGMFPIERMFEATCPPQGTPVDVCIPCKQIDIDIAHIQKVLLYELALTDKNCMDVAKVADNKLSVTNVVADRALIVTHHPTRPGGIVIHAYNIDRREVIEKAKLCLDAYMQPSHVISYPSIALMSSLKNLPDSTDAVMSILSGNQETVCDPIVQGIQQIIKEMLDLDCLPAPDSNFFHVGGSSLLASQLASKIRKVHDVSFTGADLFRHNTCIAMAQKIQSQKPEYRKQLSSHTLHDDTASLSISTDVNSDINLRDAPFESKHLLPQNSFFSALFQLIPAFGLFPIYHFTRTFMFFVTLLVVLDKLPGEHNRFKFFMVIVSYHLIWTFITPLLFILLKWTVIGRYKQGRYKIGSFYYLRWWFVDVCRNIIGRGLWGSNNQLLIWYYRMLGAQIGSGVHICLEADIAEFDLLTIGDNAKVEYATVRAFGVDNGAMLLGPITIGEGCSIGIRSVIAPFTTVPSKSHIGPASSSYELTNDDSHVSYNRGSVPEPNFLWQMLVGAPITFIVDAISQIPAVVVLFALITMHYKETDRTFHDINDLMEWLCDPRRIPYYIGVRVVRSVVAPFFYMGAAIFVKWMIIGKFKEGPRDNSSQWQLMRHWLAARLFSRDKMQDVTNLLGRHYEPISILYRLLGAKVGKRVFWPGHQPVFSGEFDLLEIGDDVVFGSRTVIICSSVERCDKVIFCAGANVSDNAIIMPGGIVGKNAVLASNTVCPAGRYLPELSIWLGSNGGEPLLLEAGVESNATEPIMSNTINRAFLPMDGDKTTLRPFGKAVYNREATHFVWYPSMMIAYNIFCNSLFAAFHALPLLASVQIGAMILYYVPGHGRKFDRVDMSVEKLFGTLLFVYVASHAVRFLVCMIVEVCAKWLFLGRRKEGQFNWDKSPYGQNWEFYQVVTRIRQFNRVSTLDLITGSPYLVWYFRSLGAKIGKDCCLYPSGGDPFMPEPDLVDIGDGCVVDNASIVAHLNTRGNFELVRIKMDNNVTLRVRSRIQQGVHCESGSMLLEKSLALTGEVMEANSVWQGAPSSRVFTYDKKFLDLPSGSFDGSDLTESKSESTPFFPMKKKKGNMTDHEINMYIYV